MGGMSCDTGEQSHKKSAPKQVGRGAPHPEQKHLGMVGEIISESRANKFGMVSDLRRTYADLRRSAAESLPSKAILTHCIQGYSAECDPHVWTWKAAPEIISDPPRHAANHTRKPR
jgi:hypothetical protein